MTGAAIFHFHSNDVILICTYCKCIIILSIVSDWKMSAVKITCVIFSISIILIKANRLNLWGRPCFMGQTALRLFSHADICSQAEQPGKTYSKQKRSRNAVAQQQAERKVNVSINQWIIRDPRSLEQAGPHQLSRMKTLFLLQSHFEKLLFLITA